MCPLDGIGEDQRREQQVQRRAHDVGGDHQLRAREAVGPYAADEQEGDERDGLRPEHEADVRRAAGEVGDEQRERDDDEPVADDARRLREPHVPERRVAKDAELSPHRAHRQMVPATIDIPGDI
jgi:hypothetical protein